MKITCVTNKTSVLPPEILDNYKVSYEKFSLEEQKEYVVYAIRTYLGYIWYCICDESYTFYPFWNPGMLFKVSDNRLSRYWIFDADQEAKTFYLAFPEWISHPKFYTELVDGSSTDEKSLVFKKYKEIMDLEFPDLSISECAEIADDEWLICPACLDGWQCSSNKDALVKCPKCQKILNNPRYRNEYPNL